MSDQSGCEAALDPNFAETIGLLNIHDIPYWVCHGTLLGLIRDGRLIPWDHDIDIAMWADSVSKAAAIELMTSHGYILKNDGADYDFLQFTKYGGREVDFNFYHVSQDLNTAYSEWFISRSSFTSLLDALSNAKRYRGRWGWLIRRLNCFSPLSRHIVDFLKIKDSFYKSAGYTTPANLLEEFGYLEMSGLRVRVPRLHEAILEYVYGKDWRIPNRQYDWKKESPSTRVSNSRFNKGEGLS